MLDLLEDTMEEFLTTLGQLPFTPEDSDSDSDSGGHLTVLPFEDIENCHFVPILEGDIAIYYDYSTDNMTYAEINKFHEWFNVMLSHLNNYMTDLGYEEVDNSDGSGGGLYYGSNLYRKPIKYTPKINFVKMQVKGGVL